MQEWSVKPPSYIIQIDIDPTQIGKIYTPTLSIVGDAKAVLRKMLTYLEQKVERKDYTKDPRFLEIKKRREAWLAELQTKLDSDTKPISPYRVMKEIRLAAPSNTIIVADSGDNLCFTLHAMKCLEPNTIIASQKLNAVGCGLPMAMGAKLAAPNRPVIAITGDGALHYNFAELATATMEKIPFTVVIMNNGYLNANKTIADFFFEGRRVWVKLNNPDWVKLANAFGLEGERVENPSDIQPALKRGLNATLPYIIDIIIDDKVPAPMTGKPWRIRW
jgi:acetolactate synthase-1/2/3 large subunit